MGQNGRASRWESVEVWAAAGPFKKKKRRKTRLQSATASRAGLATASAAPIKIGYSDWPGYTVMEVAKQKGWFKDAGLDVELVWFEYSPSIDAFAAGKIDGVTIVAGDDMVTGASGAKSKIVCLIDYSEGS